MNTFTFIEISALTAAAWELRDVIHFVSAGTEHAYYEDDFGITFFVETCGYCIF